MTPFDALAKLKTLPESQCACDECSAMCKRAPCWGTPEEIQAIIDAGYGDRLMHQWWVGSWSKGDTQMVQPAIQGHEGGVSPFWPSGPCTFLTADNKCELHDKDLKPMEGRLAIHTGDPRHATVDEANEHRLVAMTWGDATGRTLYEKWRAAKPDKR